MRLLFIVAAVLVAFPNSLPAGSHPVYVSVTDIVFNEREKTIEVTCRVFTRDYEQALKKSYGGKVDLLAKAGRARMDSLAAAYMLSRLGLSINGEKTSLLYIGYEQDEDAILNYMEIAGVEAVKSVSVTNSVLYELWEKQQSVIHVTAGGKRKSIRLTNPSAEAEFYF